MHLRGRQSRRREDALEPERQLLGASAELPFESC
jgi:hypothetical protein